MIKQERPPNFEAILKVFPEASGDHVIFAYAPDIYAPGGVDLPQSLVVHETVHIERQQEQGVEKWWDQYLADPEFRFVEELLAHKAEYDSLILQCSTRQQRRQMLKLVAKKLAAPLYHRMVTVEKAMELLKA